jgi:hypothetical protein
VRTSRHERIADLHHAAMRGGRILDRGERGAVESVAAGVGTEEDHGVALAACRRALEILVTYEAHAHGIDERVAVV